MTRKIYLALFSSALAVILLAASAKAENTLSYISVGGMIGRGDVKSTFTTGTISNSASKKVSPAGVEIAFGGYLADEFRTEIALSYYESKGKTASFIGFPLNVTANSKVKTLEGLLNFYYDFKNTSPVTPYLICGLGIASQRVSSNITKAIISHTGSKRKTMPALQVGVGMDFALGEKVKFGVGYRLKGLAARPVTINEFGGSLKVRNRPSHLFLANLKFEF